MTERSECAVCLTSRWRYKCPVCLVRYCSVPCYTKHKQSNCASSSQPTDKTDQIILPDDPSFVPAFSLEDDGSDYVPLSSLEKLKYLKSLLSNPHLRTYLKSLNESNRPDLAMERAMREPLFVEFADECLRLIHDSANSLTTNLQ